MVALGSLLVLSFFTVFGVELAELNVTLMFDGFLHDSRRCASSERPEDSDRPCRDIEGGRAEEMRHAQLMIVNLITFIEDQPPESKFGMIKLNSQNVAKISATMGAVFASMVYERVREETMG